HNIRAGGGTRLSRQGRCEAFIMALGRWESSAAMRRYIRPLDEMIADEMDLARRSALAVGAPVLIEKTKAQPVATAPTDYAGIARLVELGVWSKERAREEIEGLTQNRRD